MRVSGEDAVPGLQIEKEPAIGAVGHELAGQAARAKRPCAADVFGEILESRDLEARPFGERAIIAFGPHAREPPLAADRLQEVADLPRLCALAGEPGADRQPSARAQHPEGLPEEAPLVGHVLGALDRIDALEAPVGERVGQPVLADDVHQRLVRCRTGAFGLNRGNRHARHAHPVPLGEIARRRAVSAADVAHALAGLEIEVVGDEIDQGLDGAIRAFVPGLPEPVMDVVAPDLAVEPVELVVVLRHRSCRRKLLGIDHGRLSDLSRSDRPAYAAAARGARAGRQASLTSYPWTTAASDPFGARTYGRLRPRRAHHRPGARHDSHAPQQGERRTCRTECCWSGVS